MKANGIATESNRNGGITKVTLTLSDEDIKLIEKYIAYRAEFDSGMESLPQEPWNVYDTVKVAFKFGIEYMLKYCN